MVNNNEQKLIDYAVTTGFNKKQAEHIINYGKNASTNDQTMSIFTRLVMSEEVDANLKKMANKLKVKFQKLEDKIKTLTDLVADLEKRVK